MDLSKIWFKAVLVKEIGKHLSFTKKNIDEALNLLAIIRHLNIADAIEAKFSAVRDVDVKVQRNIFALFVKKHFERFKILLVVESLFPLAPCWIACVIRTFFIKVAPQIFDD